MTFNCLPNKKFLMNKSRRERIAHALKLLQEVLDEEQQSFDNMPEGLQQGEKGVESEDAISSLEDAISSIDQIN